jgi:hypothetical protein
VANADCELAGGVILSDGETVVVFLERHGCGPALVSDAVPAKARAIVRREREVPYRVVARIVRAGQKDGSIRKHKADQLALVFWNAIKGLALYRTACGPALGSPHPSVLTTLVLEQESV